MLIPSAIRLQDKDFVGASVTLLSEQGQSASFAISNDPRASMGDFSATFRYPAPGMFSLHSSGQLWSGVSFRPRSIAPIFGSATYITRLLELTYRLLRL